MDGRAHIRVDSGVDVLQARLVQLSETASEAGIVDDNISAEIADDLEGSRRIAHVQHVGNAAGFLGQRVEALSPPRHRVYR